MEMGAAAFLRECGPCTVCCTVLGVPELGKATYRDCEHLCGTGCKIYPDRPASCRTFACQWLRGMLEVDGSIDLELRPDVCGVMFDYQPDSAFGEAFTAWEYEPGASIRGPAADILAELSERFLVVVVSAPATEGGQPATRLVGPPHLVQQAADARWSGGGSSVDASGKTR